MAILTRGLGMKKEDVDVLLAQVKGDIDSGKLHAYVPM